MPSSTGTRRKSSGATIVRAGQSYDASIGGRMEATRVSNTRSTLTNTLRKRKEPGKNDDAVAKRREVIAITLSHTFAHLARKGSISLCVSEGRRFDVEAPSLAHVTFAFCHFTSLP
ncbi:hypothetical protein M758_UG046500 [Ceratodon purpureus]|nr:hypothetical protein M758_UG046500 [Ceratodon purpureus]